MSAFVVKDETINRIVALLFSQKVEFCGIPLVLSTEEQRARFGKELFDMNVESVRQRYGDEPECQDYQYQEVPAPSLIKGHKALSCLLYQSCEGDVEKSSLYQMMDRIHARLAQKIVHLLPEWDKAPWG